MKHNFKRVCALILAVVMCIGATLPVFASEGGEVVKCPGETATHTLANCEATEHTVYDPGCLTLGYTVYQCNGCGTYFADSWVPALDNCDFDLSKDEIIKPDYCDTKGETKRWCNTHERYTTITVDDNKGDANGEHVWGDWQIDGAACTEEGSTRTRVCSLCGKTETEENPESAAGHDWVFDHFEYKGETILPHCGEMYWEIQTDDEGKPVLVEVKYDIEAVYVCSACGKTHVTFDVRLNDLTHDFGEDVNGVPSNKCFVEYITAPTCSDTGVGLYECKNCYYQKEFEVAATGIHDFTFQVEYLKVTCTTDGYNAGLKCQNCDAAPAEGGYELVPMLGHKVTEGSVIKPTCTENGSYVCANCEEIIGGGNYENDPEEKYITKEYCGVEGLLAIGHVYTEDGEAYVHAPTCTTGGFVVEACIICLAGEITERIPALGHTWTKDTAKSKDVTCTDDGVLVEKCTTKYVRDGKTLYECTATRTTELKAPGHNWETKTVAATCYESEYTIEVCSNCQSTQNKEYVKENVKENWDEDNHYAWIFKVYTTWPTCDTAGMAIFYCPKCSAFAEQEVAAFGHDYFKKTPVDANTDGYIDIDKDGNPIYKYETDSKGNKINNVIVSIPATCYDDAYDICACTNVNRTGSNTFEVCGNTNDEDYVKANTALNHKDSKGNDALVKVATIAPTCEDGGKYGYDLYGCPLCKDANGDYTYTEERAIVPFDGNDKLHHKNAQYDTSDPAYPTGIIRPGSCDIVGLEAYYCDACESDFYYVVPNTGMGHSAATAANTTAKAKCDKSGAYTCDYCKESVEIPAIGHNYGTWNDEIPAKCTEDGKLGHYKCSNCYKYFDENYELIGSREALITLKKLGHDYTVWVGPTCIQVGHYTCVRCGTADFNGVSEPPHGHDYVKDPEWLGVDGYEHGYEFEVGCENDGYWHYYCQYGCGTEWIDSFEKMTGHTEEEIPAVDATCTTPGWTAGVKCSECDKILVAPEKVEANHENAAGDILVYGECPVVDGICTPEEGADRLCVHCNEEIIHNYVVTIVEETCVSYQYTLYVCIVEGCKHQYMEEDPTEGYGDHIAKDTLDYDFEKACDAEGSAMTLCKNCQTVLEYSVRGHKFVTYYTVKPADIAEPGSEKAFCEWADECDCEATDIRAIEALDGVKFHYSFDNAVKSTYNFVNTGRIYLTITYTAQNANVNDILLALSYDSDVLTYVGGELKCDGFDIANCEIGGVDAEGKVSIRARANAETATENVNVTLPAEGNFAVLEFAIKADVFAATASNLIALPTIAISVLKNVDAGSVVVDKDHADVACNYGTIKEQKIEKLGDVNNDGIVDDRDAVLLLDYMFTNVYSAEADINQNGEIDLQDYMLLKQYTISSISYADMCAGKAA